MKKRLIIPALVFVIGGTAVLGASQAFAQVQGDPHQSIITKLAQKFGLKEADVKAVFDEEHQQRQAEMEQRFSDRLDQLVKDSKITEEQKQLILQKRQEMQTQRESEKDSFAAMTQEQRKAAMDAKKQELEAWAKEHNIDLKYLMMGRGMHGFGMGKGLFKGVPAQQ